MFPSAQSAWDRAVRLAHDFSDQCLSIGLVVNRKRLHPAVANSILELVDIKTQHEREEHRESVPALHELMLNQMLANTTQTLLSPELLCWQRSTPKI